MNLQQEKQVNWKCVQVLRSRCHPVGEATEMFKDAIHLQQQPKCLKILNFFTTIFFLFHVTPNFLNAGVSLLLFQKKLFVYSNQLFNWTLYFGTLAGHSMRDIYLFFFRTWELPYFCVHRHSFVNVFVGLCLYILGAVVMCLALD